MRPSLVIPLALALLVGFVIGWGHRAAYGDSANGLIIAAAPVLLALAWVLPSTRRVNGCCSGCVLWLVLAVGCALYPGGCCRSCTYMFVSHSHDENDLAALAKLPESRLDADSAACGGVSLGMSRTEVEKRLGPGRADPWEPAPAFRARRYPGPTLVAFAPNGSAVFVRGNTLESRGKLLLRGGEPDYRLAVVFPALDRQGPRPGFGSHRERVYGWAHQGRIRYFELREDHARFPTLTLPPPDLQPGVD